MQKKLSIITPTFNRANKLSVNFDSILMQNFKSIEHIIVDNMSSDGTEKMVGDYIKKAAYPVVYIREKDSGIYNAMNKGIRRASAEWIHILNSDDYYYSRDSLKEIFSLDINDLDLISCAIMSKKRNGESSLWIPTYDKQYRLHRFPHPGILIKKNFYEKYGYYSEKFKIISDAVFAAKNYSMAKYLISKKPLVCMEEGGISDTNSYRHFFERIWSILFYQKFPFRIKIYEFFSVVRETVHYSYRKFFL